MTAPDISLPPAHPPRLRETPLWAAIAAWARAEAGLDWSDDDLAALTPADLAGEAVLRAVNLTGEGR